MTGRTYLCFDFGQRRIGVAAGQNATLTAQGIATVAVHDGEPDWRAIGALIERWLPDALVVGLPLGMDDRENPMSAAARRFARELRRRFALDVELWDERLSSDAAHELLRAAAPRPGRVTPKRRQRRDQIAAELILRSYMDEMSARPE